MILQDLLQFIWSAVCVPLPVQKWLDLVSEKYTKEGKPVAIPGHNLPLALGVFILWFCWFGFNCGSTTAATYNLGDIAMTTNLAAAAATLVTPDCYLGTLWKPDISMTMNGALAGLVAITASCDVVNDYEALFIEQLQVLSLYSQLNSLIKS